MNTSPRTLADLQRFAKSAPKAAVSFLSTVEKKLRATGQTAEADTVKQLLGKTQGLTERISAAGDALKAVFPETPADWGTVQLQRTATIGYGALPVGPAQYVSGTISRGPTGRFQLTTDGGRTLTLGTSPSSNKPLQMGTDKLEGFVGDGRITLMGSIGEDNTSFNVESYALNTDGQFDTFTFGRVAVADGKVSIETSRGVVQVADEALSKVLATMPKLAVIVPGGFSEKNGALSHDGKAQGVFISMARFKEPAPAAATGDTVAIRANMADNHFVMKPISFPAEHLDRARHGSRLWVRGWPEFDAAGQPIGFKANYLSQQLDRHTVGLGAEAPHADPVQASVMHEIV